MMGFQQLFLLIIYTLPLSCRGTNTSRIHHYLDEVRSLSELPLDKLIAIKSSFAKQNTNARYTGTESRSLSTVSMPMPMTTVPLRRTGNKSIRRHGDWDDKNKDTKISKIFQLTLTALSFLAFGGYLFTLIITSIRRTQTTTATSSLILLRGLERLNNVNRPKRGLFTYDSPDNEYDTERFYRYLVTMSSEFRNRYY